MKTLSEHIQESFNENKEENQQIVAEKQKEVIAENNSSEKEKPSE